MGMHHIGIVQSNNVKVIFKISCKVQNWLGLMFRVRVMCSHHVKVQHFKENLQLFMCSTSKVQDGHSMSLACLQKVYLCRWCTLAYKYYHHICNREREKYDGWIWFDQRLGQIVRGTYCPCMSVKWLTLSRYLPAFVECFSAGHVQLSWWKKSFLSDCLHEW